MGQTSSSGGGPGSPNARGAAGTTSSSSELSARPSSYIQDRIRNASPGETITIPDGVYHEDVMVDKAITLRGRDRDNVIIISSSQFGMEFVLDDGNATVTSLTLLNKQGDAITITGKGTLTLEYWYVYLPTNQPKPTYYRLLDPC
jgi:nitrous oxidase accessory protein NosD